MMIYASKTHFAFSFLLTIVASTTFAPADERTDRVTGPWDMERLCQVPAATWREASGLVQEVYYEGDPLEMLRVPPDMSRLVRGRLGPAGADTRLTDAVPAGWWQAARTTGEFSLVGCTVGPGFEFSDFALLRDDVDRTRDLARLAPDLESLA